jgi:predicted amidophosphoribosyltransferase
VLCGACWRSVRFIRAPLCDITGAPLPFDTGGRMVSAGALADPPPTTARAVAHFTGTLRTLVHHFKYADRHDARELFGQWLAEAGRDLQPGIDVIVPVPMSRLRLFLRRFNQSAVLARQLSQNTGIAMDPDLLVRARANKRQVGLTRDQRRRNVARRISRSGPQTHRSARAASVAGRRRDHHRRNRQCVRPRPEASRRRPRRRPGPQPRHGRSRLFAE